MGTPNREKVILRFLDGRMVRGYVRDFALVDDFIFIEDESTNAQKVKLKDLKAIFFVRKFEGDKKHRERKSFVGTSPTSKRVFLRFKDGESMTGLIAGDLPWEKGFFLESQKGKGFFLIPTDDASNNRKIFVVTSAVQDVTMIG
jgi:hypothetical protein